MGEFVGHLYRAETGEESPVYTEHAADVAALVRGLAVGDSLTVERSR